MIKPEEVFLIGRLTRTHGVQGEMELQFTDDAFDRGDAEYVVLLIDGIYVPFFFSEYRFKNNEAALMKFEEINSETEARRLVGLPVYYPHAALSQESSHEIHSLQAFTGFQVLLIDTEATENNDDNQVATRELGVVAHVATTSATTLFTIDTEDGDEVLIPFHEDFVVDYNVAERYLILQLPEGILDLNA